MEFVLWLGAYLVAGGFVAGRLLSDSNDGFLGLSSGDITGEYLAAILVLFVSLSLLWPIVAGIIILIKIGTILRDTLLNPLAERINKRHST